MLRNVLLICAVALLLVSGISHRLWTGAWKSSDELDVAASRVGQIPASVGDWVGADLEMDARQMARAEAVSYLCRRYLQRRTGAEVSVFLICGRPGPISVHPPTVCYQGLGFQIDGAQARYKPSLASDTPTEFYWANFTKADPTTPEKLRIYWAWKAGPGWQAPNFPRFTFGGANALYKLYITYRAAPGAELPNSDPCQDLMRDLLPELEKTLSPAS